MDAPTTSPAGPDPAIESWRRWKQLPSPQTLSGVLKVVQPTIDGAVRANPRLNPGVVAGQAKQLAIRAIKSYEPERGASLSAHVFNHLRPLSYRAAEMTSVLPRSRYTIEEVSKLRNARRDFLEENGYEPDDNEMMERLGVDRKRLKRLNQLALTEVPESALEYLPDAPGQEPDEDNLWVDYVYHDLDPISKRIMDLRTGRNGNKIHSVEETAMKVGISPGAVSLRAKSIAERIAAGMGRSQAA